LTLIASCGARFGEALEQPGVGRQIDARHERVGELAHRDVDFPEQRLRRGPRQQGADRLPPQQAGQVHVRQARLDAREAGGIERLSARRAGLGPPVLREPFQVLIQMEAERLVFPFEVEPAAELGRLGQLAVVMGQEQLGVVLDRAVIGVGQGVIAEQVAQPQDHRIDVGDGAAVPDQENVAVADLKQLALEFPHQPVEFACRNAQLVVAPVVRLQP
jgi:hypothetical protein